MSEQPHYEINVAQHGRHYFATAPRSLTSEAQAKHVFRDFCKRFPASEDFEITVTHWKGEGEVVEFGTFTYPGSTTRKPL